MRKLLHEEIPRLAPETARQQDKHPLTVIVDNVRSIHNVGSFFRTADGAWIEELILTGITGTPENRALHKTALGAQDTVNWSYQTDSLEAVDFIRQKGYRIIALEITSTPTLVHDIRLEDFPAALIIGNELSGIRPEIVKEADYALEIPQYGTKQSLNVSVAFGIALFDLVRHYRTLAEMPLLDDPFSRPTAHL